MPKQRKEGSLVYHLDRSPDLSAPEAFRIDLDLDIVEMLHASILSPDRDACLGAIRYAVTAGIPAIDLADHYIPALSQRLGEQWCSDEIGFASVTIGAARLQSVLRELGPEWIGDFAASTDAPVVLLIVSKETHHTLGAVVAAGQLRRWGVSVKLLVGASPNDVSRCISDTPFDAVFISCALCDELKDVERLVDASRMGRGRVPPVILGGTIVNSDADVARLTGADYVTSDPEEALRFCSLNARPRTSIAVGH